MSANVLPFLCFLYVLFYNVFYFTMHILLHNFTAPYNVYYADYLILDFILMQPWRLELGKLHVDGGGDGSDGNGCARLNHT